MEPETVRGRLTNRESTTQANPKQRRSYASTKTISSQTKTNCYKGSANKVEEMSDGQRAWWKLLEVPSERFQLPEPKRMARNTNFK